MVFMEKGSFGLSSVVFKEGIGISFVISPLNFDEAADNLFAIFAFFGFQECRDGPFGGEASVVLGELRIEVGLDGGEVFQSMGIFTFSEVTHGEDEA